MWFLHISAIIFPPQRLTTYIYIYAYIYIYIYIRIIFPSESIPPGRQFLTPARRSKNMASNLESTQCQPPFSGTSGIPCIAPGVVDSLEFPTWLVRGVTVIPIYHLLVIICQCQYTVSGLPRLYVNPWRRASQNHSSWLCPHSTPIISQFHHNSTPEMFRVDHHVLQIARKSRKYHEKSHPNFHIIVYHSG